MPTSGQEIAKTAHEAHQRHLASLPEEERRKIEQAEQIGHVKGLRRGRVAMAAQSGPKEIQIA